MKKVKKYLTEYIDEKAEIKECDSKTTENLPLFLKDAFEYFKLQIMNEKVLLLKPVQKQTLYRLQSWMKQIEDICGMNTVLALDEATPYMIKKMLMDRTAFIIPYKQINLPFLVMMVQTEKKKEHKSITKFAPSTQLIFLYILYAEKDVFTIEETAAALGISGMSVQRGLSDMEQLGLLSHDIEGKTGRKKIFRRIEKKGFYAEGKEYLDNPVRNTVYVKEVPEIAGIVESDLSALAEQTMLGEPSRKHYALYNRYKGYLDEYIVSEEQAAEEKLPAVQLMKYDVSRLSVNNIIDPVSMIYSLSGNDERIQLSVDELMKHYDWYTSEGERW